MMFDAYSAGYSCDNSTMIQAQPLQVRAGSTGPSSTLREGATPRNTLLAALSHDELATLRPHLERVPLRRRQVLHERNGAVSHAYFIERGTVSLLSRAVGRDSLEVGSLGQDDLLGVSVVLGTARAPHRCVVQVPGEALRIRAEDLQRAMFGNSTLHSLLLAQVQSTLVQSAQLAVCNTYHSLNERLARSLLTTLDHLISDEIPLTHRSLSQSLGVRRAGVTTALGAMEAAALLRRGRGRLRILDRQRLEQVACECHRIINSERKRLVCEVVTEEDGPRQSGGRSGSNLPAPSRNAKLKHCSLDIH